MTGNSLWALLILTLSPPCQAQTGRAINQFSNETKNGNLDPIATQKAFDKAFHEANASMQDRTAASYSESLSQYAKAHPLKRKSKNDQHNLGNSPTAAKASPRPQVEEMETAAKGKGTNRENIDTGMAAGSESGAQAVTFGSPSKQPEAEPSKKKKYRFE